MLPSAAAPQQGHLALCMDSLSTFTCEPQVRCLNGLASAWPAPVFEDARWSCMIMFEDGACRSKEVPIMLKNKRIYFDAVMIFFYSMHTRGVLPGSTRFVSHALRHCVGLHLSTMSYFDAVLS